MGRSSTPTFRVEAETYGFHMTPCAWRLKDAGYPTDENVRKYIDKFNESLKPGGCNEHISKEFPGCCVTAAKVVNQSTNEVVASYRTPSFQVVP